MSELKFRTAVACRIARIDRDRFNEAVAAGNYPCAPRTDRGATRVFDQIDLIALSYYGRLLNFGIAPRVAGHWACELLHAVKREPTTDEVVLCFSRDGYEHAVTAEEIRLLEQGQRDDVLHGDAMFPVLQRICVDVRAIRGLVKFEIARELTVIGPDDEGEAE